MKISLDTFKARARAALGDIQQDEPQPLWVWLHRLEGLLARPPVERREATGSDDPAPEGEG